MGEKENIKHVINFIDSMEYGYEKKQEKIKEKVENNEKWLKEWTKENNIFNKCFYDETKEKVENIMQELNKEECTEAEIDEMIERIDCFINTKNDIASNVDFTMGRLAVFVAIISSVLSAVLTYLIAHIDETIKKIVQANSVDNPAIFLLVISNILLIVVPVIFAVIVFFHFLGMSKTAQLLMYRMETLNLLKIRLNKLKKEKFGQ